MREKARKPLGFAFQDGRDQQRDIVSVVLVVCVGVDDDVGAALEAGANAEHEAPRKALVGGESDDVVHAQLLRDLAGPVTAAVVDDQPLDDIDAG